MVNATSAVAVTEPPEWKPDTNYSQWTVVEYNGKIYECITPHLSQSGWEPPNIPAVWRIPTPSGVTGWEAQTHYIVGSKVIFNNENYQCTQEHTSMSDWNPKAAAALWVKVDVINFIQYPPEVVLGESFTVTVDVTQLDPSAQVMIDGNPGNKHTFQFRETGKHTLIVMVLTRDTFSEFRRIEVDVKAPQEGHHKFPQIGIIGKQPTSATFMIANRLDHLPGTVFTWDFGPAGTTITDGTCSTSRSFEDYLERDKPYTTFNVQLTASFPDKTSLQASRTLVVYNRYFMDKSAGIIRPKLTYDYNAYRDGTTFVAKATLKNLEDEELVFNQKLLQYLPRDGDKEAVAMPVENIQLTVGAQATTNLDSICSAPAASGTIPIRRNELLGYVVHLKGETAKSKLPVRVSLHFQTHESQDLQVVTDPTAKAALREMRYKPENKGKTLFTREELETHLKDSQHDTQTVLNSLVADAPGNLLSHILKVERGAAPGDAPYEGQPCLTDESPPEDGLACQLVEPPRYDWVVTPACVANAHKGDTILHPLTDGIVADIVWNLSPRQLYAHCGIMTQNHYQIRHCIASEERLFNYPQGEFMGMKGTDGLQPDKIRYLWPGTVTQSIAANFSGEGRQDPESGNMYTISSNWNTPLEVGPDNNRLPVQPLVVKPDPFVEAANPECRKTLHKVADIAKTLEGHYRLYGFSNSAISMGDMNRYLAPKQGNWWSEKRVPYTASNFIWAAMKQCQDPKIQLEGEGTTTKPEELEPRDIARYVESEVDPKTKDGLYFYKEGRRHSVAEMLFWFGFFQRYRTFPGWVPESVSGNGAENEGNQLANAFAFDWIGENDMGDDSKDGDGWKTNVGVGRAVTPSDILNWDAPSPIKDGIQHGVYGYWEPTEYHMETVEWRRISQWVRVKQVGTLSGTVTYKGQPVPGASIDIGGSSFTADANGNFSNSDILVGTYDCVAGKPIDGSYMSATVTVTIRFHETTTVVIELKEPNDWYRNIVLDYDLQIHEQRSFLGIDEGKADDWYPPPDGRCDLHPEYHVRIDNIYVGPYDTHEEVAVDQWCSDLHVLGRVSFDWKFHDKDGNNMPGVVYVKADFTLYQSGHKACPGVVDMWIQKGGTGSNDCNIDDGDSNFIHFFHSVENRTM